MEIMEGMQSRTRRNDDNAAPSFLSWGCGLNLGGRHTYQLCRYRYICPGYYDEKLTVEK